ncbi:type I-E CRISPR-associated protein Cse1/CasA [Nocardia amamiensis]|uniref:type I-E CRISPR-associated protein Cse1/CasA n=1 Tax=Nocardia amamiensis TaxID=404578 RepID=UPI0033F2DB97
MNIGAADVRVLGWIPVRAGRKSDRIGLRELFIRAHNIDDVEVGLPPAASGLWRLLTVIAARVTGLDAPGPGPEEWLTRRDNLLDVGKFDVDEVERYFHRFEDRWMLFGSQRPWLQDPRLAEQCSSSSGLNKLVFGRPAGNNQPWLSHHHDGLPAPLPVEDAVLHLIAQLYYGAPGRCTARTVDAQKEANNTAGPLRGLVSFHPVGKNLFESLVVGIPRMGTREVDLDKAAWEVAELADPLSAPPPVNGVGGVLAGRFRHAVLLVPSEDATTVTDAYLTWAWRQPHGPVEDPFLIYQTSQKGEIYPRPADAHRALWRDLDGLLLRDVGIEHRRRPAICTLAEQLEPEVLDRLRIQAFGFDQDRAQVNDRQWYAAATPPVLDLLTDNTAAMRISRARETAERAERHLRAALRNAWVAINDPSNGDGRPKRNDIGTGPWPALAVNRYWPEAEREFWRQVWAAREGDIDQPGWPFIKAALAAFDEVTAQAASRPRTTRALERARSYIYRAAPTQ